MTTENGRERRKSAKDHLEANEVGNAGEEYVQAAFEYLGAGGSNWQAKALQMLLQAMVCYQIDGNDRKVGFGGDLGETLALDAAESHSPYPVEEESKKEEAWYLYDCSIKGAWYEYVGDFRLVRGADDYDEMYDRAIDIYERNGDLVLGYTEQPHNRLFDFYCNVTRGIDRRDECNHIRTMKRPVRDETLTSWVEYKRETLPGYLETLFSQNEWMWWEEGDRRR